MIRLLKSARCCDHLCHLFLWVRFYIAERLAELLIAHKSLPSLYICNAFGGLTSSKVGLVYLAGVIPTFFGGCFLFVCDIIQKSTCLSQLRLLRGGILTVEA